MPFGVSPVQFDYSTERCFTQTRGKSFKPLLLRSSYVMSRCGDTDYGAKRYGWDDRMLFAFLLAVHHGASGECGAVPL